MKCNKCGFVCTDNAQFCPNCGNKIAEIKEDTTNNGIRFDKGITMSEKMASSSKKFFGPIIGKIKQFVINYKKQCLIGSGCVVGLIVLVVLFNYFFGFERLSWDKEYDNIDLEYVTQTNLKLGIEFSNEEGIDEIKYTSNCGEVEGSGLEVVWNLTESIGECKITASYRLRKISKEYKVISFNINENDMSLDYEIDLDSDEDLDLDGLTNKEEKGYKTNPMLLDSDMDGIDDYYELFTSKTDPNKKDTDGDGLSDYDEIELELNPLLEDSKGDGVKDGERTLTYNYTSDKLKVSVTGKGNIASTVVEVNSNTKISSKTGLIDNLYTFYTDGKMDKAEVVVSYTDEEIKKYGLNEDNLSIYYYNEKDGKYEKMDTVIDKVNKTVKTTLDHFSNYVVGDNSLVLENTSNQILFVLDNSWSMYTNEQYNEITGNVYSGTLDGFDALGVRFTLTSDLITRLSKKNYQMGLSEFRRDYANMLDISSDTESLKEKLKKMNGQFVTSFEGTNISNALFESIGEFSKDSDNKYIVILTDGQDSSLSNNTKKIIEKATDSGVKICSIGFGSGSDNVELSNISNGTGCKFYSSSNVSGLNELFENIGAELNDDLVDIDNDNEEDGILVADSGFIVNRDGFSFANYASNLTSGHCYGMATFAELYYKKVLPSVVSSKTVDAGLKGNISAYGYNLNDTYFEDYGALYNYKLQTNVLKHYGEFGFTMFSEEIPADYRKLNGTMLILNDKYKDEIENSLLFDIKVEDSSLDKETQLKRWGVNYENAENIYFNEDRMQNSTVIDNDDKQMFNAIYTSFIRQHIVNHYASGTNFIVWGRNVLGTEHIEYTGKNGFINILKTRLNDKDAPVISFNGHAINAISLVQDIENPNYYYIGVYDNNYPGEKRYVEIECNKDSCATKENDYYSVNGEVIRITPSLEYDLEYYNN